MRLHPQLVTKILNYVHNLGGHKDDSKLRAVFSNMDFTAYTRESTGEVILVETEEYLKKLRENG